MPLTATDNVTDLDITQQVNLDIEPGCEHPGHPQGKWHHTGPAWGVIRRTFRCGCMNNSTILICESAYKNAIYLHCPVCREVFPRDEGWQLVSVL